MGIKPKDDVYEFHQHGYITSTGWKDNFYSSELKYHKSWDWLMPVITEITTDQNLIENEFRENIMDSIPYGQILDTHENVVNFIKWHNANQKSKS